MIQVFQVQNFFSIREKQTLTFLPAKYNKIRCLSLEVFYLDKED